MANHNLSDFQEENSNGNCFSPGDEQLSWEQSFEKLAGQLQVKRYEINRVKTELQNQEQFEDSIDDEELQISLEELRLQLDDKSREAETIQQRINDLHIALKGVNDHAILDSQPNIVHSNIRANTRTTTSHASVTSYEHTNEAMNSLTTHRPDDIHMGYLQTSGSMSATNDSRENTRDVIDRCRPPVTGTAASHSSPTVEALESALRCSKCQVDDMKERLHDAMQLFTKEERKFNGIMLQMEQHFVGIIASKNQEIDAMKHKLDESDTIHLASEETITALYGTQAGLEAEISETRSEAMVLRMRVNQLMTSFQQFLSDLAVQPCLRNVEGFTSDVVYSSSEEICQGLNHFVRILTVKEETNRRELNRINTVFSDCKAKHQRDTDTLLVNHAHELKETDLKWQERLDKVTHMAKEKDRCIMELCLSAGVGLKELQHDVQINKTWNDQIQLSYNNLHADSKAKEETVLTEQAKLKIEVEKEQIRYGHLELKYTELEKAHKESVQDKDVINQECACLRRELAAVKNDYEKLRDERMLLEEKLLLQQNETRIKEVESHAMLERIKKDSEMKEKLLAEKTSTELIQINQARTDASNREMQQLVLQLETLRHELRICEEEKEEINAKFKLADCQIQTLNEEVNETKKRLDDERIVVSSEKSKLIQLQEELGECQMLLTSKETERNDISNELQRILVEKSGLKTALDEKDVLVEDLKHQASLVINCMEEMRIRYKNVESECENKVQEFKLKDVRIESLSKRCGLLAKKLREKHNLCAGLKADNELLVVRVKEIEEQIVKMRESETLNHAEILQLQTQVVKLTEENQTCVGALSGKSNQQQRELANVLERLKRTETDLHLARKCLSSKRSEDKKALKSAMAAQNKVTDQRMNIDALRQKSVWLQEALDLSEEARLSLEKKLTKSNHKLITCQQRKHELQSVVTKMSSSKSAKEERLKLVEGALAEAARKFMAMQQLFVAQLQNATWNNQQKKTLQPAAIKDDGLRQLQSMLEDIQHILKMSSPIYAISPYNATPTDCAPVDVDTQMALHRLRTKEPVHVSNGAITRVGKPVVEPLVARCTRVDDARDSVSAVVEGQQREGHHVADAHLFYLNNMTIFTPDGKM